MHICLIAWTAIWSWRRASTEFPEYSSTQYTTYSLTVSQEVFFFSSPSVLLRPISSMSSLATSPQLLHSAYPVQPFLCFVCSKKAGRTEWSRKPCNCKAGLGKSQSGPPSKHYPSRMAGLVFSLPCVRKRILHVPEDCNAEALCIKHLLACSAAEPRPISK